MANGQIYITISDKRGEGGAGETPGVPSEKQNASQKNENDVLGDYAKHQFFTMIKSNAKKTVSYSINNIGNFTGDYQAQRNISEVMSLVGAVENIGMSAIAGAKVAGVWGAVIAAGITAVNQGINFGLQEHSNRIAIKQQNRNIDILRDISGLNTLNDGSRGTEN